MLASVIKKIQNLNFIKHYIGCKNLTSHKHDHYNKESKIVFFCVPRNHCVMKTFDLVYRKYLVVVRNRQLQEIYTHGCNKVHDSRYLALQ